MNVNSNQKTAFIQNISVIAIRLLMYAMGYYALLLVHDLNEIGVILFSVLGSELTLSQYWEYENIFVIITAIAVAWPLVFNKSLMISRVAALLVVVPGIACLGISSCREGGEMIGLSLPILSLYFLTIHLTHYFRFNDTIAKKKWRRILEAAFEGLLPIIILLIGIFLLKFGEFVALAILTILLPILFLINMFLIVRSFIAKN